MLAPKSRKFRFYLAKANWPQVGFCAHKFNRPWHYCQPLAFWGKLAGGQLPDPGEGRRLAIDLTMTPCSESRATAQIRRPAYGCSLEPWLEVKVPRHRVTCWCREVANRLFFAGTRFEWTYVRVDIEYEVIR